MVGRFLTAHGIKAEVIRLDGAVENAVGLGLADVIADVVDTGGTLRQAGLEPVGEPLLDVDRGADPAGRRAGQRAGHPAGPPAQRGAGGAAVRDARLRRARRQPRRARSLLTPGIESPTISPLHREGWVAVQAMVLRTEVHRIMDELYDLGARAILVTDIHACRL